MSEAQMTPPAGQRWTRNEQSFSDAAASTVARDLAPLYKHMRSKAKEKPMFSNELTPAENERLALLAEEMGEAIQAIGKILRHGYESTGPKTIVRNRTSLEKELGDVRLAISLMVDSGDLSSANLNDFEEDKRRRVGQYLHHNTLTPNEATVRVEDRSRTDPAKVLSVRLEDLLRVLDKAADHFVIPCQTITLPDGMCPNCRDTLELKSELLKMASILRAEVQEKMKTGMPFGAKSKNEAKTEANNRKKIK